MDEEDVDDTTEDEPEEINEIEIANRPQKHLECHEDDGENEFIPISGSVF